MNPSIRKNRNRCVSRYLSEYLSEYLATIGSKGGKSGTGASKRRKVTSAMARAAALARWAKRRQKAQPAP